MAENPHFLRNDDELRYSSLRRIVEMREMAKQLLKFADEAEAGLKRYFGVGSLEHNLATVAKLQEG